MAIYFPPLAYPTIRQYNEDKLELPSSTRQTLIKETILIPGNKDILVFLFRKDQRTTYDAMVREFNLEPHLALFKEALTNQGHESGNLTLAIFTRFGKKYKNRVKVNNL